MQTRSGLCYNHAPIDVFDIKVEPSVQLTEEVDETGLLYLKSLLKANKAFCKRLKKLGFNEPEKMLDDISRFSNAKTSSVTNYSVSNKCKEFTEHSELLPSRLWASNPFSVQSAWCPIRNILIGNDTWDIDQSNCWMRILLWIIKELRKKEWQGPNGPVKINIPTPHLENWINNKKSLVREWMMTKKGITEKMIKKKLACIANWNGNFKTGFAPFQDLNKELNVIQDQLKKIPEFKMFVTFMKNKFEKTKSCETIIGVLTKAVEANLTWACVRELKERGVETCVVVHDGMNVYKNENFTPESICEICDEVCEFIAPGSAVWCHKPPNYTLYTDKDEDTGEELRVPDDWVPKIEPENDEECPCGCGHMFSDVGDVEIPEEKLYKNVKQEFEKNHAQIHCEYIDEEKCDEGPVVLSNSQVSIKSKRLKYYTHHVIKNKDGEIVKVNVNKDNNFFPKWDYDEDKRYYRRRDTFPDIEKCPCDVYNDWVGYSFHRTRQNMKVCEFDITVIRRCAFVLRHIHRLIDDNFRDFFLQWICHLIKYPDIKVGIMIGLLGAKRIGKGQSLDLILKMIGMRYYCSTSHPSRDVWGTIGTDFCFGKMLCRFSEAKESEYKGDHGGAFRHWITDNPVNIRAMHHSAETVVNYTRFIHDGNDPVLPDEQDGGRVAQTLCNPHWKDKWIDDESKFVEYNTTLGQYIDDPRVQVMMAYIFLRHGCPKRFSFHTINQVTGNYAKEERKRNRTLLEKFLVQICEFVPWTTDKYKLHEHNGDEEPGSDTINFHLEKFNRYNDFRNPITPRCITTSFGKHIAMKFGGIEKIRPWDEKLNRPGNRMFIIDLKYFRERFSMNEERIQSLNDTEKQKPKTIHSYLKETCDREDCNCTCGKCELNDEQLLEQYVNYLNDDYIEPSSFEQFILHGTYPSTKDEDYENTCAVLIQNTWRSKREDKHRISAQKRAEHENELRKEEERQQELRANELAFLMDDIRERKRREYEEMEATLAAMRKTQE